MSKTNLFLELVNEFAKDKLISKSEFEILIKKGAEIGLDRSSIESLIDYELEAEVSEELKDKVVDKYKEFDKRHNEDSIESDLDISYTFKTSFIRGGSLLTPGRLEIDDDMVTYKKRNSYLIFVDTKSIPIRKIASVSLDRSIVGTDVIINTYGNEEVRINDFSIGDAREIKRILEQRL